MDSAGNAAEDHADECEPGFLTGNDAASADHVGRGGVSVSAGDGLKAIPDGSPGWNGKELR